MSEEGCEEWNIRGERPSRREINVDFVPRAARTRNTRFRGAVNFKLQKYARARRRK